MGDIFDQIQENARAQFLYSKAKLVLEFEDIMSVKDKKSDGMFPTWIQVLKPTSEDRDEDDVSWVGKLRAVKRSITNVGVAVDKKFQFLRKEVEFGNAKVAVVDKNVAAVDKKVDAADSKLEKLTADNAELKNLLVQMLSNKN